MQGLLLTRPSFYCSFTIVQIVDQALAKGTQSPLSLANDLLALPDDHPRKHKVRCDNLWQNGWSGQQAADGDMLAWLVLPPAAQRRPGLAHPRWRVWAARRRRRRPTRAPFV